MIDARSFQIDGPIVHTPRGLPLVVAAMGGGRRIAFLMIMGALAALALPPVGFLPILLLSLPALIWAWAGARRAVSAGLAGFWWGLGYYTAGIYWIAYALLTDAAKFGWMIPFATLGLGAVMSAFTGLAMGLGFAVAARIGAAPVARVIWAAIAWTVAEWLRTFVLTGFPWNPLSSVWDQIAPMAQVGALFGSHGLTLVTFVIFALVAVVPMIETARARVWVAAAAVALPVGLSLWGGLRLLPGPLGFVPGVTLRLVQPNVDQAEKWRADLRDQTFLGMIDLSRGPGFAKVTHVIWPETAALFPLDSDSTHRNLATLAVPPQGLLLTGAPRIIQRQPGDGWQFWNSLIALDGAGEVQGIYDKAHLVPFGEYVPMRKILPLPRVVSSGGDFSAGPGPRTLKLPGLPDVGPLICYESIFPGAVIDPTGSRPRWLLVVTNDGWFGISAGPHQHLAAGRQRAIEEGLPVVRAANTGISAVFDPYGRVVAKLGLGERGIIDAPLPLPLPTTTPYGTWGDSIAAIMILVLGLMSWGLKSYD